MLVGLPYEDQLVHRGDIATTLSEVLSMQSLSIYSQAGQLQCK
jgi:hypothetical protein